MINYIIKKLLVWELAITCPPIISFLIKTIIYSFKLHNKSIDVHNKVYTLTMQLLSNIYFSTFIKQTTENQRWKELKFILCDCLGDIEVLEKNIERVRYFVNSVVLVCNKSKDVYLDRDERFSNVFVVNLSEFELLRQYFLRYFNANFGLVDQEEGNVLSLLHYNLDIKDGYTIVVLTEEVEETSEASLDISLQEEESSLVKNIIKKSKEMYQTELKSSKNLLNIKIRELALIPEEEYKCIEVINPQLAKDLLDLKSEVNVCLQKTKPTENDIVEIRETLRKIKRSLRNIEKYVDLIMKYNQSKVFIQHEIEKLNS